MSSESAQCSKRDLGRDGTERGRRRAPGAAHVAGLGLLERTPFGTRSLQLLVSESSPPCPDDEHWIAG